MHEIRQRAVAVVARFGLRPDVCDDIAQDTVLRLLAARGNGHPPGDETAFAVRTAVNLTVDRFRRLRRSREKLHDIAVTRSYGHPSGHDGANAEPLDRPAEVDRLYEAIAQLPERQAAVVALHGLAELGYAEIAAILGTTEATCRSLHRHGMTRLRERLAH
ncbi:MAG: sigma-70 family RNA polymerase sigma factor [Phycisphaerales bacterium]|nr:sigma-70 family RNA polymerase sigma factor [Phycisphaerales bacterium]